MMPARGNSAAPVPPPAYHRTQARLGPALYIDALTLINTLHLLLLCRLAVRLAHHRCPPPFPAGPDGAPRTYREESLLLIALLRTLWRLSYQDMHDWLVTGRPWSWRAACRAGEMVVPVFQVHRNNANVGNRVVHHSPRRFSYSIRYLLY